MNKKPHYFIIILLMILSPVIQADNLRIAVAANFYDTARLVKQQFEQEHNDSITIIRGSTGKLFAQIKHGAPYDVFLAADSRRPELLEQQKLIISNSRTTYAIGQLALWSNSSGHNVLQKLKNRDFTKLAIANPKIAPYGEAAIEVLQQLELYNTVKPRLVFGENIAQTFQFVQSGSADLGFVALAQVKNTSTPYWVVPANSHHKLEQQLVILKSSNKPELAKKFVSFMLSENIRQLIRQQGYETL